VWDFFLKKACKSRKTREISKGRLNREKKTRTRAKDAPFPNFRSLLCNREIPGLLVGRLGEIF